MYSRSIQVLIFQKLSCHCVEPVLVSMSVLHRKNLQNSMFLEKKKIKNIAHSWSKLVKQTVFGTRVCQTRVPFETWVWQTWVPKTVHLTN